MDFEQYLYMAILPLVTIITTTFSKILYENGQRFIQVLLDWIKPSIKPTNKNVIKLSYKDGTSSIPITAILNYVTDKKVYSNLSIGKVFYTSKEKEAFVVLYPEKQCECEGIYILYSESVTTNADKQIITYWINLESLNPPEYILAFIEKCIKEYDAKMASENSDSKLFISQNDPRSNHYFQRFPLNNKTRLDDLVFSSKALVETSLAKLKNNEIPKLSFLFHGKPGCGKTSTIKAIAKEFDMNIIWIKLSLVKTAAFLTNIFYTEHITYETSNSVDHSKIPEYKRLYVLEEVDVDTDILHNRRIKKYREKRVGDTIICTETKSFPSDVTIKLSDVLNILDGLKELNGCIIIMTTNRPKILDPAIVRYGRIDANIHFTELTNVEANQLIHKYFPGENLVDIKDYQFTPAELKAHCQLASSIQELKNMLKVEC